MSLSYIHVDDGGRITKCGVPAGELLMRDMSAHGVYDTRLYFGGSTGKFLRLLKFHAEIADTRGKLIKADYSRLLQDAVIIHVIFKFFLKLVPFFGSCNVFFIIAEETR